MSKDFIYEIGSLYEVFYSKYSGFSEINASHSLIMIRSFVSSFDKYKDDPHKVGLHAVLDEIKYPLDNFEKYFPSNVDTEESYRMALGFICIIKSCLKELLTMKQEIEDETE